MTNIDLVARAMNVYNTNENWTYVQGAIGNLAESDRVRGLYNYFWNMPEHGGNSMTKPYTEWLEENIGKFCTDCSNFINFLLGYTFSMYSTKSFAKMKKFDGDISKAPLGTVLCMEDGDNNGHVGIVVAEDRFVDFYKYNETCRMGKTSESLFKFAVYITGVEYVESLPPYVFTVSLNPDRMTHFVGDPVQKEDFIVNYYDGEGEIHELKEFAFTPSVYTNTVNTIAIVTFDSVEYIAVPAESKGDLYVIQIPCASKADALAKQAKLMSAGYYGTSVLQI